MRIRDSRWWCRCERDGGQSEGERETRVGRVTGELLLPCTPWHSHNLGESLGFSNTLNEYRQWYILWRIPRFRHRPEYQKMAKVDDVSVYMALACYLWFHEHTTTTTHLLFAHHVCSYTSTHRSLYCTANANSGINLVANRLQVSRPNW